MVDSTHFLLSTIAVVVLIACYFLFIVKLRLKKESPDSSVVPSSLQETKDELLLATSKDLSAKRREELLEKIKEQRIKEYLYEKKRKMT